MGYVLMNQNRWIFLSIEHNVIGPLPHNAGIESLKIDKMNDEIYTFAYWSRQNSMSFSKCNLRKIGDER